MYTLCSKVPQFAPTLAMVFGVPEALTIAQVLLIDIGTDIWTAIAYAFQPAESRLMARAPRHPKLVKLADWGVGVYSYCYIGVLQCIFCWIMFFQLPDMVRIWNEKHTGQAIPYTKAEKHVVLQGKTVYYWTLVMGQIAAAISTTTERQSLFSYCFPNMALNLAFLFEVALGVAAIYIGFMQDIFDMTALNADRLLMSISALVCIGLIEELRKALFRHLEERGLCGSLLDVAQAPDCEGDDYSGSGSTTESSDDDKPLICG